jgi:hypothetical protein
MNTRRLLAAVVAASLVSAPLAALAQGPGPAPAPSTAPAPAPSAPPDTAAAGQHYQHGVTLYDEQDYSGALAEFQKAYQLAPNWQVLFNIGQAQFQMRDYAHALVTLQKYVTEGGPNIPPDKKQTVDTELADLANRVGRVSVTANLDGATITIDDQVVGTTPLKDSIMVSAGTRKIEATHDGRLPVSTTVSVAGGDNLPVTLTFAAPVTTTVIQQGPAGSHGTPTYVPGIVALSIGAAGLVVGSIFGAIALGNKSDLDKNCPQKACTDPAQQSSIDTLSRNATLSTVGFVVAGVGAAAGLYLLVAPPTVEQGPPAAVRVHPWVGLGSAGLNGTF